MKPRHYSIGMRMVPATAAAKQAPGPSFSGSATTVGSRDRPAVESYGADEILLDCFAGSLDARLECLHRLADALGLLSSPNANQPR